MEHATQLLVQALVISWLDYCNALLAGLPSSTFKPLQRAQKKPVTPLFISCTGYRLQLTSSSKHWCLHIEQPQAQHPLTSTHWWQSTSPPEVWDPLVSNASWYHHREAQNPFPEHSRSPLLQATTENSSLLTLFDFILNSRLTQKLAYTSSNLTWDLIIANAHVHIDKFGQYICTFVS